MRQHTQGNDEVTSWSLMRGLNRDICGGGEELANVDMARQEMRKHTQLRVILEFEVCPTLYHNECSTYNTIHKFAPNPNEFMKNGRSMQKALLKQWHWGSRRRSPTVDGAGDGSYPPVAGGPPGGWSPACLNTSYACMGCMHILNAYMACMRA